ncbi:hypothetical protein ACFV99_39390 [Streptomyces sp. NPDC059944]|uniref:hypothetical protein n=1 Tax=unclassified Streptomyces TaxID=2593676 RepID=UPI0036608C14
MTGRSNATRAGPKGGTGTVTHTERPFLSVPEVYRLADAVPQHCRALILLAAFAALRFGELAALQRRDIDLEARTASVRRSYAETRTEGLTVKAPKSARVSAPWRSRPRSCPSWRSTWRSTQKPA